MKEKTADQLAYIGGRVMENMEARNAWKEQMRPLWIREGQRLRELREKLDIPRCHIAKKIHVSDGVLYRLQAASARIRGLPDGHRAFPLKARARHQVVHDLKIFRERVCKRKLCGRRINKGKRM